MKPFDFNIHPNISNLVCIGNDLQSRVDLEFTLTPDELYFSLTQSIKSESWNKYIYGFNCMIFSMHFQNYPHDIPRFVDKLKFFCCNLNLVVQFTLLIDPRSECSYDQLFDTCSKSGIKFIKFHSYHQQIESNLIPACVQIAKIAQLNNIGICIDASYGSLGLFKYDNLLLASEVLMCVKDVPVVILHCGGLRCYEAALIAIDSRNAFIELSFSPHFYRGTDVYNRFVDVLKMLPVDRFLYASDYPYVSLYEAVDTIKELLCAASTSPSGMEKVFRENALSLFI